MYELFNEVPTGLKVFILCWMALLVFLAWKWS